MGGAVSLYRGEGMFSTPVTAGGFWYMTGKIGHADAEGNNFCAFCVMRKMHKNRTVRRGEEVVFWIE